MEEVKMEKGEKRPSEINELQRARMNASSIQWLLHEDAIMGMSDKSEIFNFVFGLGFFEGQIYQTTIWNKFMENFAKKHNLTWGE